MNISARLPVVRDEFGTRPAFTHSTDEYGQSSYSGRDPDSGDSVEFSVRAGEYCGTEISGSIGGKRLDVYVGTDEFGQEEISGSGAEEYKQLIKPKPDPWTDWM